VPPAQNADKSTLSYFATLTAFLCDTFFLLFLCTTVLLHIPDPSAPTPTPTQVVPVPTLGSQFRANAAFTSPHAELTVTFSAAAAAVLAADRAAEAAAAATADAAKSSAAAASQPASAALGPAVAAVATEEASAAVRRAAAAAARSRVIAVEAAVMRALKKAKRTSRVALLRLLPQYLPFPLADAEADLDAAIPRLVSSDYIREVGPETFEYVP
jgi:hypothetical protein